MNKNKLEQMAWNLISELDTCPQGHIISHKDVVDCMIKFAEYIQSTSDEIPIHKIVVTDKSFVPIKTSKEAACYDLKARDIVMEENLVKVYTGIKVEPADGWKVDLFARSSISKTGWMLANSVGKIDNDYRGELILYFARVDNSKLFPYKIGDRVAQMEFMPYYKSKLLLVNESDLSTTKRGESGFGSTGK